MSETYTQQQPAKQKNTIGLIAMIVSIVGFIFACIPGALIVGWILLPIAFVLGIVGVALSGKKKGKAVTAIIVSIVGTIVGFVVFFAVVGGAVDDAFNGEDKVNTEAKAKPAAIGETVELEGTEYTVESAKTAASVGDEFSKEKAGGVYVIVKLKIENKKDETKTFSDEAAKFIGDNDKKYSTDDDGTFAAIGDKDKSLILEDMQPDVPKTGVIVFDVPKKLAKGGILEVSDLFGNGEAYIDLGL